MADREHPSDDTRSLQDIRESVRKALDEQGSDSSGVPEEYRAIFDDLCKYHDALDARQTSMQGALATLVDDMSQTSQTLNETGTRLDAILEAVTDVAFVVTRCDTGKIVEFSAGAEHIFGYSKSEIMGKQPDMLHPAKDVPHGSPTEAIAANRMLLRRQSGEEFPALVSFYPLRNSVGEVQARLMIAVDNSRRELVERYLRETREKYEALALSTPVSIMAFDQNGIVQFVNDWHMQMFDRGLQRPEFYIGKKVFELPALVRAGVGEKLRPVLQGQLVSLEDIRFPPFGDREEIWQNIRCSPLVVGEEVIGGIIIREDITRRKQTEHDLKMLIDYSPISILKVERTDAGRIIRYLNPEALSMFGKDALNQPEDRFIVRADGLAKELSGLRGEPCLLHTLNGQRQGIRSLHESSGLFEVHAVMDVSVLVEAKEAAEDISRAKSDFLANISHEIRTPLNVLLGMLQLFQDEDLGEDMNEMTEHATGAALSLLGLLNDILDFSVVEARAWELDEQDFNLPEVVELVARPYRFEAESKGLELECLLDPTIPELIRGDSRRLRQIIFHLVGNAVKFTDRGKVSLEAAFLKHPRDEAGRLILLVSDTGIGIPEDQLDHIFEPFRQADGSRTRRHGGTGIGLSLVQEFISAMGGSISIFSEPGVGTEFIFSIDVTIA
ncbi:ATP-binding protein [uncultured Pseudodesulfovibrio sp.]|uniref:PAS domain-containing sensor histidine kinase n=1 Tax=uncultured Pseudodesulfovibrio sp. TaxID=2035858 RepID=UPI0029C9182E|nr:ATP-binding protein [uncultured Pseudodesulfovibrio sp.]